MGNGVPSFSEFAENPEKFRVREDWRFAAIDGAGTELKHLLKKAVYEIEGYRCKSLEEVERVAASQGIPIKSLDYRPELIPLGGGKYNVLIKFIPQETRIKRQQWG